MHVTRTIKPGQPGTRRFQQCWGDKLVAVRYRKDDQSIYTTIEVIVDERQQVEGGISLNAVFAHKRREFVAVKIAFGEYALRKAAKQCGAIWSTEYKVWLMPYSSAVSLAITDRIVEGLAERCVEVRLLEG